MDYRGRRRGAKSAPEAPCPADLPAACSPLEQRLVQADEPRRHRLRRQRCDGRKRPRALRRAYRGIEQSLHAFRQRGVVERIADPSRVVRDHQFARATTRARHHGESACEGLEHRVRQWIVERGQDERIGGAVVGARIELWSREHHALPYAEATRQRDVTCGILVATDDDEPRVRRQPRQRADRRPRRPCADNRNRPAETRHGASSSPSAARVDSRCARTEGPNPRGSTAL